MGDKISEEEGKKIIEAFEALKLIPKCDTPEDLKKWLEKKSQLGAAVKIKTEQTDETTKQYVNFPRISTFSGSPRGETSLKYGVMKSNVYSTKKYTDMIRFYKPSGDQ